MEFVKQEKQKFSLSSRKKIIRRHSEKLKEISINVKEIDLKTNQSVELQTKKYCKINEFDTFKLTKPAKSLNNLNYNLNTNNSLPDDYNSNNQINKIIKNIDDLKDSFVIDFNSNMIGQKYIEIEELKTQIKFNQNNLCSEINIEIPKKQEELVFQKNKMPKKNMQNLKLYRESQISKKEEDQLHFVKPTENVSSHSLLNSSLSLSISSSSSSSSSPRSYPQSLENSEHFLKNYFKNNKSQATMIENEKKITYDKSSLQKNLYPNGHRYRHVHLHHNNRRYLLNDYENTESFDDPNSISTHVSKVKKVDLIDKINTNNTNLGALNISSLSVKEIFLNIDTKEKFYENNENNNSLLTLTRSNNSSIKRQLVRSQSDVNKSRMKVIELDNVSINNESTDDLNDDERSVWPVKDESDKNNAVNKNYSIDKNNNYINSTTNTSTMATDTIFNNNSNNNTNNYYYYFLFKNTRLKQNFQNNVSLANHSLINRSSPNLMNLNEIKTEDQPLLSSKNKCKQYESSYSSSLQLHTNTYEIQRKLAQNLINGNNSANLSIVNSLTSIINNNSCVNLINNARKMAQRFKLLLEGDVHVCKLQHSRNVISKILNSKLLRRWKAHRIILTDTEIYSTNVIIKL